MTPTQFRAQLKVHTTLMSARQSASVDALEEPTTCIDQIPGW